MRYYIEIVVVYLENKIHLSVKTKKDSKINPLKNVRVQIEEEFRILK